MTSIDTRPSDVIECLSLFSPLFVVDVLNAFYECSFEKKNCPQFVWGFFGVLLHDYDLLTKSFVPSRFYTIDDFIATMMRLITKSKHFKLIDFKLKYIDSMGHSSLAICINCLLRLSSHCVVDGVCPICNNMFRKLHWNSTNSTLKDGIVAGLMVIYNNYLEPFVREPLLYDKCIPHVRYPMCTYDLKPLSGLTIDGDESFSMYCKSGSLLSCTYYHSENIHQVSFSRDTKVIGIIKVNIRAGVDINSCDVNFWCKSMCSSKHEFVVTWYSNKSKNSFCATGCWTLLHCIASCLDSGGSIITHPSRLECIDSESNVMMCIGVCIKSTDDNMPGVIAGYSEAWITTSNTITQSYDVTLIEPYGAKNASSNAMTRCDVHRQIAKNRTICIK